LSKVSKGEMVSILGTCYDDKILRSLK